MNTAGGERPWTIVLLGASGQLGHELARSLANLGRVVRAPREGEQAVDLAIPETIERALREHAPEVVVNAAAYTAVDRAEHDEATAHAVNARAAETLAGEAKRCGAFLVHYSTDYVFSGSGDAPYTERDATAPASVYGRTKLEGERLIEASGVPHLIFRTSWLYSVRGRNFLRAIASRARAGEALRVVDDQVGSPTAARYLADLTAQVLAQARTRGRGWLDERGGLYHASAAGSCTWFELARAIVDAVVDEPCGSVSLHPVSTREYGAEAPRPAYSVLDNAKLRETFGLELPGWREQLAAVLDDLVV